MKMYLGNIPIKSMNMKHYEVSTNDATLQPSDMQAGVIAYARGKRVVGTGKCFEFARYGTMRTNTPTYISNNINIIELASTEYPIKLNLILSDLIALDFSVNQKIATVNIDGIEYDLTVNVSSNLLKINCDKTFALQVFYGKDAYA